VILFKLSTHLSINKQKEKALEPLLEDISEVRTEDGTIVRRFPTNLRRQTENE